MFGEREAFEKAIDADPLEATNHLAYADWLDENGEPDEAAFRRSMGEWIGKQGDRIENQDNRKGDDDPEPWYDRGWGAGGAFGWPQGTLSNNKEDPLDSFDYPKQGPHANFPGFPATAMRTEAHHPVGFSSVSGGLSKAPFGGPGYFLRWHSYRGMEEAMRRAFMKNRPKPYKRTITLPRRRFSRK